MDRRTKRIIEREFINYKANKSLRDDALRDIAESGTTIRYDFIGKGNSISNPTESKYLKYEKRYKQERWAEVVEFTFAAFKFSKVYDVLEKRFIEMKSATQTVVELGIQESSYGFWLDKALNFAYMWALELGLLTYSNQFLTATPRFVE